MMAAQQEPALMPIRVRIAGGVALAWLGMYVHNVADLPNMTLLSPESLYPGIVWLSLLGLALSKSGGLWALYPLLGWTWLNLVGGFLTVLPLPTLPFKPEQTARHYAFHMVYAVAQLPPLWTLHREVRLRGHALAP